MRFGDEQHQPVLTHRKHMQPRIGGEVRRDRYIDAMIEEVADQGIAVADRQRQAELRVAFGKGAQGREHVIGRIGAEPQMSALQAARGREKLFGFFGKTEDAPRQVEQRRADGGQDKLSPSPLDQLDAIGVFERLHLSRERRLGDAEPRRRPGETAGAGDGMEGAELGGIHRYDLYLR
jgi:hypothetical protein